MTDSRPLDVENERDEQTTSFQRDEQTTALIENKAQNVWTVSLPDGDGTHRVALITDYGVFIGQCTCDGFNFHEKPCAYLFTIRKADTIGYPDVDGKPVEIERITRDLEDDRADQHDNMERVRAHGGRRVLQ